MYFRFGPTIGPISVITQTPPPVKTEVLASLVSSTPTAITLAFPGFDPAASVAPIETRAYFLPAGMTPPDGPDAWVASGASFGTSSKAVDPAGDPAYVVPGPAVTPADYYGQVIHCFDGVDPLIPVA